MQSMVASGLGRGKGQIDKTLCCETILNDTEVVDMPLPTCQNA